MEERASEGPSTLHASLRDQPDLASNFMLRSERTRPVGPASEIEAACSFVLLGQAQLMWRWTLSAAAGALHAGHDLKPCMRIEFSCG